MTNVIKVKFLRSGKPSGRAYTYYTPVEVAVDDVVELESRNGIAQGVVTEVDVPEEEILVFGDDAKSIIGLAPAKAEERVEETKQATLSPEVQKIFDDLEESLIDADAS
jgi:hypothetical protein